MSYLTAVLPDEDATEQLGATVARHLRPGDVVLLYGDLGCGKTTLVRGAAGTLGVREPVTSPSFALLHIYTGVLPVYHCDAYRLSGLRDVEDLGFYEWCESGGVVFVEWAERLDGADLGQVIKVLLSYRACGDRLARVEAGADHAALIAELSA